MNHNVNEIMIWFVGGERMKLTGEDAGNATAELFKYSREGVPRFVELGKDYYHAADQVSTFAVKWEEDDNIG